MTGSVHVIIVNWNTGRYLHECLESIAGADQRDVTIARVTVVDNASSDASAEGLEHLALPLELIRNSRNVGFGAACNQGAAASSADYLLFLNPDTRLLGDTLAMVTRWMARPSSQNIGICGVQMVDAGGAPAISCARFPTLRVMIGKMTGLHLVAPRVFPGHHLRPSEIPDSRLVDQVIGAFFFVRRDLFERLGGFDTRYFLYFEEVDFALRARRLGAHSYFLGDAIVHHAANVSSDRVRDQRLYHSLRSRRLYARAHWSPWQAGLLVVLSLTLELVTRLVRAALRRDMAELSATACAYRRFVRDLVTSWQG